jgi:hypothetical protein
LAIVLSVSLRLLAIVLSVSLWFMNSDYHFDIINLFLVKKIDVTLLYN